jgi:hypothetical protein
MSGGEKAKLSYFEKAIYLLLADAAILEILPLGECSGLLFF